MLDEAVDRSGVDPEEIGDSITGCVSQVGEQSSNIDPSAWLTATIIERLD